MFTEKKFSLFFIGIVSIISACLVTGYIIIILSLMTPIHFWDQWEMAKYISEGGSFSLNYLIYPHNEHIISTSKFLSYIDFWFFEYTNKFLVATIIALHVSIACVLAFLLTKKFPKEERLLWFLIFGALMLSLAQWENLTIGFQTQFGLTSLFAIFACASAAYFAGTSSPSKLTFSGLAICTPLTVFSMGNGIALVCSFAVITVLVRARTWQVAIMFSIYAICLAIFVAQISGSGVSMHVNPVTMADLPRFFLAVLGGTFTSNFAHAVNIGTAIVISFLAIFVFAAFLPWIRRQEIDRIVIIFLAIAIFALASAAAVTIGRISFGPGAALTSRYATPNLLLCCSILAAYCRHFTAQKQAEYCRRRVSCVFALLGIGLALGLSLRTDNLRQLTVRSETLTSAGYFVLSGVMSNDVLAQLYPAPDAIRAPIEYLRSNKLNIFSPRFGLTILGRNEIDYVADLATCAALTVERTSKLEEMSWQVSGRIQFNHSGRPPRWIIATSLDGNVLGYAPPRKPQSANSSEFFIPVHGDSQALDGKIYLVAQWSDEELCRHEQPLQLPDRN